MANSRTVAGLARVYQRLAARGIPVEQYPGWQRRGRGAYIPRGHVEHCTSDARPLPRDRMLQLLANGHGSLRNALCTWATPREDPAAVLIAAEVAWHAGRGGWQGLAGNSSVSGTEIQRAAGQAITTRQLQIARAITQEMTREFAVPLLRVCTHNEWTPRKVDPVGVHGPAWRDELSASLDPWEEFMATLTPREQEELKGFASQIVRRQSSGRGVANAAIDDHRGRLDAKFTPGHYRVVVHLADALAAGGSNVTSFVRWMLGLLRHRRAVGDEFDQVK